MAKAYATGHNAGTISAVDLDKLAFVGTIAAGRKPVAGPEAIAFSTAAEGK